MLRHPTKGTFIPTSIIHLPEPRHDAREAGQGHGDLCQGEEKVVVAHRVFEADALKAVARFMKHLLATRVA